MAGLTICTKNFFAAIARRKFNLLAAAGPACHCLFRRGRRAHWIESAGYKISRVTAEVRAAEEDCQTVNCDEPYRERLGADAWFAFLTLHSCVHLLHVGLFAIIHSLPCAQRHFRFVVHCTIFWLQQAIPRLPDWVMRLEPLPQVMHQPPARH